MSSIQWVLFDLGGIIVPETGELLNSEMASCLGISPSEMSGFIGAYKHDLTTGKLSLLEMYRRIIGSTGLQLSPEEALARHLEIYRKCTARQNPEVLRIIGNLKRHSYRVACLTNTELEIARLNNERGLYDYFDRRFRSVDLGMKKPDAEIYRHVIRELACPSDGIVFIDDVPVNILAAEKAGMCGILYRNAIQFEEELTAYCPTFHHAP